MKKFYLLFSLLLTATLCFGQKTTQHTCYKGLVFTVKNYGYKRDLKAYAWGIQVKNTYNKPVSFRYYLFVGDEPQNTNPNGGTVVLDLDPGQSWTNDYGELFALLKNSESSQYTIAVRDVCFKGSNCYENGYFDCDGNQTIGGRKRSGTVSQQSNNSTNAQDDNVTESQTGQTQQNIMALISKKNNLCDELRKAVEESGITSPTYDQYCVNAASLQYTINDQPRLLNEIAAMENGLNLLNKQQEQKKHEEEEKKRIEAEKQKRFDDLISQGDHAYDSKSYDKAMAYYTQAKNEAMNEGQRNLAIQKYNQAFEAKRTAERYQRVESVKQKDKTEDATYVATAGAVAGMMSILRDDYLHNGFDVKFLVGLGYAQTPMVTNQNNTYAVLASYADKAAYPTVDFGLKFEILNNKPINVNLRGLFSAGLNAFETGVNGIYTVAGVDGGIQFWYKTATRFKLFADVGWYERTGERTRDHDAISGGTSATDDVREGKYKYAVLRIGFGPMLHFRRDGRETWIKPGVYFDQLSFAKQDAPKMLFALNMNIQSSIVIEAIYGSDYPVAGTINYPSSFIPAKQDYFSVKIIKQGKFW